jgi:hypothetical protein
MELWQIIAIGVAVIIIAVAVGWFVNRDRRTRHFRERYGPEYDRRVAAHGNRRRAETELARGESRVRELRRQPLNPSDRTRFAADWERTQARFVDDPTGALDDANRIVVEIMRTRGYSVDSPNDRIADVSAAYPNQAARYREANDIMSRHRRGDASTEDLRRAFVNYRYLFDDMLGGKSDEELKRAS